MRSARIYRNGCEAGTLTQHDNDRFEYRYSDAYFTNDQLPAISLTLPKSKQIHTSSFLFPFFFNMLSEGANKKLQCRQLRIDEKDHFGLLLATANTDTIGAITIENR